MGQYADKLPDTGDDADDGVQPFSSEWKAAVQERVDAFVVSLPLGTTPEDAEIEEKVAVKLYDAEIGTAAVRSLMSEWCTAARELQTMVRQQQADMQRLEALAARAPAAEQELQELRHALEAAEGQAAAVRADAEAAAARAAEQAADQELALVAARQQQEHQLQEALEVKQKHDAELEAALVQQAEVMMGQHAMAAENAQKEAAEAAAAAHAAELAAAERRAAAAEAMAEVAEQRLATAQRQAKDAEKHAKAALQREADAETAVQQLSAEVEQDEASALQQQQHQLAEAHQALAAAQRQLQEENQGRREAVQQAGQAASWLQEAEEAERERAAEASDLQAQLAVAQGELSRRQAPTAQDSEGAAAAAEPAEPSAVAADQHEMRLRRQAEALRSELEAALARLEEGLRAEHASEIAALEEDFAGVAADMQGRFDVAMRRERDAHSAQLQGLQAQLLTPMRQGGCEFDDESDAYTPAKARLPHASRLGGRQVLAAPASIASERRDNPLYSPSSSGTAMPVSPKASPVPLTPVFGRHQASDSEAADGGSGYSAAGAQANGSGSQVSAAEERQAAAPCGQAACVARLAQLTQLLDERAEEAAVMQEELLAERQRAEELAAALEECQDTEELYTERQRAEELAAALEECQDMVDALQQFSHDQGRDLAAAHTQLQARQPHIREATQQSGASVQDAANDSRRALDSAQELIGSLQQQLVEARGRAEAAEAAAKAADAAREAAAGEAHAARGRCAALEQASESALATVQDLSARLALASSAQGSDGEQRADVLAAELAAEARRRAGAEAVVEELSQYNTAIIEQAQEQNEALLAQLHTRERTIRDLMLSSGAAAAEVAAYMAGIDARQLDTAADYQPQPGFTAPEATSGLRQDGGGVASPPFSPPPAAGTPATGNLQTGGGSTPGLRRPRPRSMSATPLHDAAVMQRLRFSASRGRLNTAESTPAQSPMRRSDSQRLQPDAELQPQPREEPEAQQPADRPSETRLQQPPAEIAPRAQVVSDAAGRPGHSEPAPHDVGVENEGAAAPGGGGGARRQSSPEKRAPGSPRKGSPLKARRQASGPLRALSVQAKNNQRQTSE